MNHDRTKIPLIILSILGWLLATSCTPRAFPRELPATPQLEMVDTGPVPLPPGRLARLKAAADSEAGAPGEDLDARLVPATTGWVAALPLGAGCPLHSSWAGEGCACEPGYTASADGRLCQPGVTCPAHARPLDENWCLCDPGYQPALDAEDCELPPAPPPECPEHATAQDGVCTCDSGYEVDDDGEGCVRAPVLGRVCRSDADCSELAGSFCLAGSAGQGLCSLSCYGQSSVCGARATCACSDASCSGAWCFPACQQDADCVLGFQCTTYLLADGTRAGLCALGPS